MIKRIIELSRQPAHLCVRDEQLLLLSRTERPARLPTHPPNLITSIPCEDLGMVMVDERETTYTHHALATLAAHGCAVVFCGANHQPVGVLLPYPEHTETVWRIDAQVKAGRVKRKQLWAAIVKAKVVQQASLLTGPHAAALIHLANRVRSGDPENIEAQAAKQYWATWLGSTPFSRRPGSSGGQPPNDLLDYGYAVVRAALARAIVLAGLIPAIGLKHSNRSNAFCLADDLIEPFRPYVDARVRWMHSIGQTTVSPDAKSNIISLLYSTLTDSVGAGPFWVVVQRYVASFVRALSGKAEDLDIPSTPARTLADAQWQPAPARQRTFGHGPAADPPDD